MRYEVTLEANNRPWLMTLDAAPEAPQAPGFESFMTSELLWIANRPVSETQLPGINDPFGQRPK